MAELAESGTPRGVRREGGSMVRMERRWSVGFVEKEEEEEGEGLEGGEGVVEAAMEMARRVSATAISSREGSKRMFEAMRAVRIVIGGRREIGWWCCWGASGSDLVRMDGVVGFERG